MPEQTRLSRSGLDGLTRLEMATCLETRLARKPQNSWGFCMLDRFRRVWEGRRACGRATGFKVGLWAYPHNLSNPSKSAQVVEIEREIGRRVCNSTRLARRVAASAEAGDGGTEPKLARRAWCPWAKRSSSDELCRSPNPEAR